MLDAPGRYRQLERRLWLARWRHEGRESSEEDTLLDEMDTAWADLSEGDRRRLNEEGSRCWPMEARGWVPTLADVAPLLTPEQPAYGGFGSVAETIQDFATRGGS